MPSQWTRSSFGQERRKVARDLDKLAQVCSRTEDGPLRPSPLMRQATLDLRENGWSCASEVLRLALSNLALRLEDTGRSMAAEALMRRALAIHEKSFRVRIIPSVANDLNNLAVLVEKGAGRQAESELLKRRALAIEREAFGSNHPLVALNLNNIGGLLARDTDRVAEAPAAVRRALAINEKSYGPNHPSVAAALNELALLLTMSNRAHEAEGLYRRALAIDEASFGPDHFTVSIRLRNLAVLLAERGDWRESVALQRRARPILSVAPAWLTTVPGRSGAALRQFKKLAVSCSCPVPRRRRRPRLAPGRLRSRAMGIANERSGCPRPDVRPPCQGCRTIGHASA